MKNPPPHPLATHPSDPGASETQRGRISPGGPSESCPDSSVGTVRFGGRVRNVLPHVCSHRVTAWVTQLRVFHLPLSRQLRASFGWWCCRDSHPPHWEIQELREAWQPSGFLSSPEFGCSASPSPSLQRGTALFKDWTKARGRATELYSLPADPGTLLQVQAR